MTKRTLKSVKRAIFSLVVAGGAMLALPAAGCAVGAKDGLLDAARRATVNSHDLADWQSNYGVSL